MDIWADIFPTCSRMFYYALDGVGIRGPAILNRVLQVVIAHLVFGPWMFMTFMEDFSWNTPPIRFP